MSHKYHGNAKTNIHIRKEIQESTESVAVLAKRFSISESTVRNWKNRQDLEDRSTAPHKTPAVLSEIEQWVICEIRITTMFSIEQIVEIVKDFIPQSNFDNIYRCLKKQNLGNIREMRAEKPQKTEAGEFKEYEPGFLHIDLKYMPQLPNEPKRKYLFVAIDRATRYVYFALKDNKDAKCAYEFLDEVIEFYPYKIHKILTDNGKEFTDRFARNRKAASGKHLFDIACNANKIEHRLTKPYHPSTNGMVERYNRRIEEILAENRFDDYNIMMEALKKYLNCYNYWIKQKALGYKSPIDVIKEYYLKKQELFKDNFDISQYNVEQPNN
jgi:transposase InsO family protein